MRVRHRAVLACFLVMVMAVSFPAEFAADAQSKAKPDLSLEAVCVTRINDEATRWLSLTEMAALVRMLRRATPYAETQDVPWEYCIALTTEQGSINCYYNAAEDLICLPPYTNVLRLPCGSSDLISALYEYEQSGMMSTNVPYSVIGLTANEWHRLALAGEGLSVSSGGENTRTTVIAVRAPFPEQAGVEIVGVTRLGQEKSYHIYVNRAPQLPDTAAIKINLPVEAGFVYRVVDVR